MATRSKRTSEPAPRSFAFDAATLKKQWARLHRGDCEPLPKDPLALEAWRLFHCGDFLAAAQKGRAAGGAALNAAVKAQVVHATNLVPQDKAKLQLLEEASAWAEERRDAAPKDANAQYLFAFATGRYSQQISVAKALAQGLGGKLRSALEATLAREPKHAEAHTAFGAYHAEVLAKVGAIVGRMTYGASKDAALEHYQRALELFPESPIARIEYANGLILLFGKARLGEAEKLYAEAAACAPADAMEALDVGRAKAELE